jgi:hypothetical protein
LVFNSGTCLGSGNLCELFLDSLPRSVNDEFGVEPKHVLSMCRDLLGPDEEVSKAEEANLRRSASSRKALRSALVSLPEATDTPAGFRSWLNSVQLSFVGADEKAVASHESSPRLLTLLLEADIQKERSERLARMRGQIP